MSTPAKSKTSSAARATSKVSPMETSPPASDADDDNDDDGDDPGLEDYSNDDDDDGADPRLSQLRFSLRRGDTVSQTELAAGPFDLRGDCSCAALRLLHTAAWHRIWCSNSVPLIVFWVS